MAHRGQSEFHFSNYLTGSSFDSLTQPSNPRSSDLMSAVSVHKPRFRPDEIWAGFSVAFRTFMQETSPGLLGEVHERIFLPRLWWGIGREMDPRDNPLFEAGL